MDFILALRLSFVVASVSILIAKCIPVTANRFLAYGSRETESLHGKPDEVSGAGVVNSLAALRVPHGWFASFYVISTFCSLLWAHQVMTRGFLFQTIAAASYLADAKSSMTLDQVTITWILMMLQGSRRLYECLSFTKPSNAQMWIGHWLFGVWYYMTINIAIWVEGTATLLEESHQLHHLSFRPPSLRTFVSILIFILASGVQHDCHAYLASLKKYTIPEHPIFQSIVCPHYLAECLIYLAMSLNAAPPGYIANPTIFCAFLLVLVNLGITADGTKKWYETKFGYDSVSDRWRMIPFLY